MKPNCIWQKLSTHFAQSHFSQRMQKIIWVLLDIWNKWLLREALECWKHLVNLKMAVFSRRNITGFVTLFCASFEMKMRRGEISASLSWKNGLWAHQVVQFHVLRLVIYFLLFVGIILSTLLFLFLRLINWLQATSPTINGKYENFVDTEG